MFCPKCGNRLPDGSAFCGKCGTRLAAPAGAGGRPTAGPTPSKAVVLSLLPWLEVDPVVSAASGYAGGLASLLGAGDGSFSFDESYAVWARPSFAGAFGDYASLYGALGGEGAGAASALVGGAAWGCLLLWLAGVVLLALGAVRIARSGRRGALVAGAVAMAVCAAVFCGLSGLLDGIASATAFPLMCLAASVAAAVCALAAKRG